MLIWFIIMIGVIALDQITKWLAVEFLTRVDTFPIIEDVLHLTYLENKGAAFGMLKNNRWVFLIISTVAIIALLIFIIKNPPKNKWLGLGISFIVGGGIGNMIDRTCLGYVVDFIDIRLIKIPIFNLVDFTGFRLINFAIFNVADSFVCIGAVLVFIYIFFFYDEKRGENGTSTDSK